MLRKAYFEPQLLVFFSSNWYYKNQLYHYKEYCLRLLFIARSGAEDDVREMVYYKAGMVPCGSIIYL